MNVSIYLSIYQQRHQSHHATQIIYSQRSTGATYNAIPDLLAGFRGKSDRERKAWKRNGRDGRGYGRSATL